MKRSFFILMVALIAFCTLFVSCNANVEAPVDELVTISFDNDSARALSSNLEAFTPEAYYWKYAAKKADTSNLISGQTANYDSDPESGALWIKEGEPGFGVKSGELYTPFRVQGFSQGLWNFRLFGYKKVIGDNPATSAVETEYYLLAYSGETTGVLLKQNGTNLVKAIVSPTQAGNGTLVVKITGSDKITLDPATPGLIPNTKIKLKVEKITSTATTTVFEDFVTEDYDESLEAGTYKVTVKFTNDDASVIFASGSVISTVYANLTTTVKGNLTEVITSAIFGAEQNPDIITTSIGTAAITQGTTESSVTFTSTTETKVAATMPTAAAKSLITAMEEELDAKTSSSTSQTSDLTLNLSVNTTEATETTVTYEIGMEATLIYEKKDAQASQKTTTKSTVETLDDFVTVVIDLRANLQDVSVTHSGTVMTECASLTELEGKTKAQDTTGIGFYFYDSASGKLYIKTWKFSPFKLSYTVPEAVAAIGSTTYTTLEAAVDDANDGDTVVLIKGITLSSAINVSEDISLDLGGNTITLAGFEADFYPFIVVGETALTVKNGSITVKEGDKTVTGIIWVKEGEGSVNVSDLIISGVFTNKYTTNDQNRAGVITSMRKGAPEIVVDGCEISYVESSESVATSGTKTSFICIGGEGSVVILKNSTFEFVSSASTFRNLIDDYDDGCQISILDCNVTTNQPGFNTSKDTVILDGNTWGNPQGYDWLSACLTVSYGGAMTVNGGQYTGQSAIRIWSSGGTVIVNGGTFTAQSSTTPEEEKNVLYADGGNNNPNEYPAVITVTGGSFSGKIMTRGTVNQPARIEIRGGSFENVYFYRSTADEYNTIIIYGGTFDIDPSDYVAEGYIADYNSQTEKWTVREATEDDYVASVTSGELVTKYFSLQSAVAAANVGDTVTLLKSISTTDPISLDVSKALTIDGNNKTITRTLESSDGSYAVTVFNSAGSSVSDNVNVTLTNLNIEATNSRGIDFSGYLNVELNGGEITVANNCVISFGNGDVSGPVRGVVKNITSTMTGNNTGLWNNNALCVAGGAEVCIESGSFTGPNAVSAWASGGTITIEGGSFTTNATEAQVSSSNHYLGNSLFADTADYASVPSRIIVEENSTATFDGPIHIFHEGGNAGAKIFINGGTFNNYEARRDYSTTIDFQYNDIISISGGVFDANPNGSGAGNDLMADGYYAKYHPATDTAAAYWTVEAIPSDAVFKLINNETQEVKYLNSVKPEPDKEIEYPEDSIYYYHGDHGIPANHTLVMLKDYEHEVTASTYVNCLCFAGDDITFDLGGHMFTYKGLPATVFYADPEGIKNLEIKNGTIKGVHSGYLKLFLGYDCPDADTFILSATLIDVNY